MGIKEVDQLGEIGEGPGQPVDLVDGNNVDSAGPDLGEKLLQGRAVKGGPGLLNSKQTALSISPSACLKGFQT